MEPAILLAVALVSLPSETVIHVENDAFFGKTDSYYTNGLRLSHVGSYPACSDVWRGLALPSTEQDLFSCGFALGQDIYTPSKITPPTPDTPWPDPNDRPYAGWLYLSAIERKVHPAQRDDQLDSSRLTFELAAGVVGPASGAEFVQTHFHQFLRWLKGSSKPPAPVGWDAQLPNEPGFFLWTTYERPLRPSQILDLTGLLDVKLGTIFTSAGLGLTIRLGWLGSPFDLESVIPSGPLYVKSKAPEPDPSFQLYGFARGRSDLVLRNEFLDGTAFRDSVSVAKRPYVAEVELGVVLRISRIQIAVGAVVRTQEMANPPPAEPGAHRFGEIQLEYVY
jgi:hypothetical protein